MLFSPENIDKLLLQGFLIPNKWQCLYAPYPKHQPKTHRVILIHKTETELTFLSVQSETNWIKNNMLIPDVVCISNQEWDHLTKNISYIVCRKSSLIKIPINDFFKDLKNGHIQHIDIPKSVISKVKTSIRLSKTFTQLEKDEILNK